MEDLIFFIYFMEDLIIMGERSANYSLPYDFQHS